ncbi:uncharacterized protein LOC133337635 [Musca vetustissima]|uniref:uncharacterized protein LOC133337635 n=1 Tax=Musca vetustissima TaxID=27455 RepID=UPI002AB68F4C|nr:uncharacterized protein LOC133337635 [Musca vetustissima]
MQPHYQQQQHWQPRIMQPHYQQQHWQPRIVQPNLQQQESQQPYYKPQQPQTRQQPPTSYQQKHESMDVNASQQSKRQTHYQEQKSCKNLESINNKIDISEDDLYQDNVYQDNKEDQYSSEYEYGTNENFEAKAENFRLVPYKEPPDFPILYSKEDQGKQDY